MEISIPITKYEKIQIPQQQVDDITRARLMQLVSPGEYLRTKSDKVVLMHDDPDHRHGSIAEIEVREATAIDVAVFRVLDALKAGVKS